MYFRGDSLGEVTVNGDSCAGDSLPYEEYERIASFKKLWVRDCSMQPLGFSYYVPIIES